LKKIFVSMMLVGIINVGLLADNSTPPVKKSNSNICHPKGGTYYSRTKHFTPFATMDDCIKSGGRPPKK